MTPEEIKKHCPEFAGLVDTVFHGRYTCLPSRNEAQLILQALAEARKALEKVAIHHDDAYCGQDLRDLAYMAKAALPTPPSVKEGV
jgi:hypothetical protein